MLRLTAHLPYPTVGRLPVFNRALHRALQDRPHDLRQVVARLGVQVHRVEHRAPHVVLLLVVRAVADPDRLRSLVSAEVIESLLSQLVLAADAVHDLEVFLAGRDVRDEIEEVVRLAGKAERVKAPQHEGAVADPRVAVVPVALAADGLRQRRGRRRKKRAGRAVREALERQRAALEVALPRVFGEVAPVDPLAPEVRGALDALERFLDCGRRRVLVPVLLARRVARARPHHGHVGLLTLAEDLGRVGSRPFETDPQVGDQLDRHLVGASARDGLVVALPGVLPPGGLLAVVEDRLAVDADLDVADHAARGAEEDVLGLVVGWRTAVGT